MRYEVKVRPLDKPRNWEVLEDFHYKGNVVPEGFKSDGASIPIGLRWYFPHGGAKFPAAIYHDWGYRKQRITRKDADDAFLDIMLANRVPVKRAKAMYYGVRVFGIVVWHKNKRKLS